MVIAVIALCAAVGGLAVAAIPDRKGEIPACFNKKTGNLRVLVKGTKCKKGEKKIAWNQKGVPGVPGTPGTPGQDGAPGQPGSDAAVTARDSRDGEVTTTSSTLEQKDGPSVTVNIPSGGAFVVLSVEAELMHDPTGCPTFHYAFASLVDVSAPSTVITGVSNCNATFVSAASPAVTINALAGAHTYELRYARDGSGTGRFKNRRLRVSVIE
jgi:hypothetical protein